MTPLVNADGPTMFAVRVDPTIFPVIGDSEHREDLRIIIAECIPGQGTVSVVAEPGGIWRFRGPLHRSFWKDLTQREMWLRGVEITARAYLETLTDELGPVAAGPEQAA